MQALGYSVNMATQKLLLKKLPKKPESQREVFSTILKTREISFFIFTNMLHI